MFYTIHRINSDHFPISIYNGNSVYSVWGRDTNYVYYLAAFHASYNYRIACQMYCLGDWVGQTIGRLNKSVSWFDRSWRSSFSSKIPLTVAMLYLLSHRMWVSPTSVHTVGLRAPEQYHELAFVPRPSVNIAHSDTSSAGKTHPDRHNGLVQKPSHVTFHRSPP